MKINYQDYDDEYYEENIRTKKVHKFRDTEKTQTNKKSTLKRNSIRKKRQEKQKQREQEDFQKNVEEEY